MKKLSFILSLVLLATLCLAQSPPMPPGYKAPKKKVVLMSPKHASQVTTRMTKTTTATASRAMSLSALAGSANVPTSGWVPVSIIHTDGNLATNISVVTALKFTSPNPNKGNFIIMVSDDLNDWHKIKVSSGDDPLVVYDFTYLTQRQIFYKFAVDTPP